MKFIGKYKHLIVSIMMVIALAMLFLPCGYYLTYNIISYRANGFQIIFGLKDVEYVIYGFNIFGLIMILLVAFCAILPFTKLKDHNLFYLIEAILSLVSTILMITLPKSTNHAREGVRDLFHGDAGIYFGTMILALAFVFCLYNFLMRNEINKENKKEEAIDVK